jgi:hypothetical protein
MILTFDGEELEIPRCGKAEMAATIFDVIEKKLQR